MFDKLVVIENKFEEINNKLSDPDVTSNHEVYKNLMKEHSGLGEIVTKYREYKDIKKGITESKELLSQKIDKDFKELVDAELCELAEKIKVVEKDLKFLLLPKDPNDDKNVIIEIRGGAGGEEAALFASNLFRMYTLYAENKGWKYELLDSHQTGIGGLKEVVFTVTGQGAYSRLKFESGVHRVQRVPETESSGRIHTSTITVAVLPEVEDVEVDINQSDLDIATYRASGAGGQHVNTTDSAIRIIHKPTNIAVTCQDQRSQLKNKEKAMKILRSKLYEIAQEQQDSDVASNRKSQVGTGDRSERIRTYNYPQSRVTDHRINLTLYKLSSILDGTLDEIIDSLITSTQSENLANNEF
ncbi:MAG: peptide chain release factor 1 [Clostridiales bacterium]